MATRRLIPRLNCFRQRKNLVWASQARKPIFGEKSWKMTIYDFGYHRRTSNGRLIHLWHSTLQVFANNSAVSKTGKPTADFFVFNIMSRQKKSWIHAYWDMLEQFHWRKTLNTKSFPNGMTPPAEPLANNNTRFSDKDFKKSQTLLDHHWSRLLKKFVAELKRPKKWKEVNEELKQIDVGCLYNDFTHRGNCQLVGSWKSACERLWSGKKFRHQDK